MKLRIFFVVLAYILQRLLSRSACWSPRSQRPETSRFPSTNTTAGSVLANRPGKSTETPPLPYVLNRADLKFRVTNCDVLGAILIDGETLGGNSTKVSLTTGMTILDARQGSRPLPLLLDNGTHIAVLPGASDFSVSLEAGLPLTIETGRASFALPVPSAGAFAFRSLFPEIAPTCN